MNDDSAHKPVMAREIRDRNPARRLITIVAILVMILILAGSAGIFFLDTERGGRGTDTSDEDGQGGRLNLDVSMVPDTIISVREMRIEGNVTTTSGSSAGDVSIAVTFPDLTDISYRTFTDPQGRFSLDVSLPFFNTSGEASLIVAAEKEGYAPDSYSTDLEYRRPPEWTFMVYMSDCDLEAWALRDINEMESLDLGDNLNVVVQLDRWESLSSSDDRTNENWTTTKRLLVQNDDNENILGSLELEDLGEINSADPKELVDFAKWTMEEYPSDHYALVLWNHGSGVDGICWEQSLDTEEVISIDQLGWAADRIVSESGRKLDILGFDACLMSAIEVAYEINPYADYMIGSEISEPAFGWDYSALMDLTRDPYLSPMEAGISIIDRYIQKNQEVSAKKSVSLGLYDLSSIPVVVESLNDLSNTITAAGSAELYNMKIARKYAQPVQEGHSSDAVDLYDILENIERTTDNSLVRQDAGETMQLLDDAILHFGKIQFGSFAIDGLHGLSIYAPDFRDVLDSNEDYSDLKMSDESGWTELLMDYYDYLETTISERVLDFNVALLSCSTSDEDGDGCSDTLRFHFSVSSLEDDEEAFLGLNVYNLRGDHITSIGHDFNVSSDDPMEFTVTYTLDEGEGGPGLYRITAYLCRGNTFDPAFFQDYTRSGYRWLEVNDG